MRVKDIDREERRSNAIEIIDAVAKEKGYTFGYGSLPYLLSRGIEYYEAKYGIRICPADESYIVCDIRDEIRDIATLNHFDAILTLLKEVGLVDSQIPNQAFAGKLNHAFFSIPIERCFDLYCCVEHNHTTAYGYKAYLYHFIVDDEDYIKGVAENKLSITITATYDVFKTLTQDEYTHVVYNNQRYRVYKTIS